MPVRRTLPALQALALLAFPHGGQHAARRNAWAAMSDGSARARARREATAAMDRAATVQRRTASAR